MYVQGKALIKSRAFWLAVIQAVAGVYAVFVAQYPGIESIGWIAIAKSVIDVILRYTTTMPVASVLSGGSVRVDTV